MNISWKELLKRSDLGQSWLELRRGDMWFGGPIKYGERLLSPCLQWHWVARLQQRWVAWDYLTAFTFADDLWPTLRPEGDTILIETSVAKLRSTFWGKIYLPGSEFPATSAKVLGLPSPVDRRQNWRFPQVMLSQAEWIALCGTGDWRKDKDYPALPGCCGNISALRADIQHVMDNGGFVWPGSGHGLKEAYGQAFRGGDHLDGGTDWTVLNKFMRQAVPGLKLATAKGR
jgi:hypothetical protein